ncbi:carboxymuconolactone decarboxylase family protein, partial [Streptomyces sp. TRM76130]|nr:carboxymuconolactone decarboxylase family protein [Streptomyces sp. TRM76130]
MNARLDLFANPVSRKLLGHLNGAGGVLTDSSLPHSTQELVKIRASQINGCGFCLDMHTKDATAAGETPARLNLVAAWREATV